MEFDFRLNDPDEMTATLCVTMKVKSWRKLRSMIEEQTADDPSGSPWWQLRHGIEKVTGDLEDHIQREVSDKHVPEG